MGMQDTNSFLHTIFWHDSLLPCLSANDKRSRQEVYRFHRGGYFGCYCKTVVWRGIPAETTHRQSPVLVSRIQEQPALTGERKVEPLCAPICKSKIFAEL